MTHSCVIITTHFQQCVYTIHERRYMYQLVHAVLERRSMPSPASKVVDCLDVHVRTCNFEVLTKAMISEAPSQSRHVHGITETHWTG